MSISTASFAGPGDSDTPVITSDLCGTTVLTKIQGTSTEAAGTTIKIYLRASLFEARTQIGSTVVKADGSWDIFGLSLSAGLISATATASGEFESPLSSEIQLTSVPIIAQGALSNPTLCGVLDGSISLTGFTPFATYEINYTNQSGSQSVDLTADALGSVQLSALGDGEIQEVYASVNGCTSNTICAITLVEPTIPSFSLGVPVQPIICGGTGSILIAGAPLSALDYGVSYFDGSTTVNTTLTSNAITGIITISGLAAGTYSDFQVSRNGCDASLLLDRITLYDGLLPSTVALGTVSQPTTCTALDGEIELTGLLVNTSYEVYYENDEGTTVSSTISTPLAGTSLSITGLGEGGYRNIRVENLGCFSTPLSQVDLASLPTISAGTIIQPLNCLAANGSIEIQGLVSGETYDVAFEADGVDQSVSLVANGSGIVELTGLASASYAEFFVEQGDCQSNILDDIITLDPIEIPEISLGTTSVPTTCAAGDGSIQLLGLLPSTTYDVSYSTTGGLQSVSVMSNGLGEVLISGLDADEYSDVSLSLNGCASNTIVCPIDLNVVPSLSLGAVTPESACGANDGTLTLLGLQALTSYDLSYNSSEGLQTSAGVLSSAGGAITISGLSADTYAEMTVTLGGCTSETLSDISIGGVLMIASGAITSPTTCGGSDGSIVLSGLSGSTAYDVSYTNNAGAQTVNLTSNGSGLLTIPNLEASNYSSISVNDGSCESNQLLDAITLTDPGVPTISLGITTNPTSCVSGDGSITLGGLLASTSYDVFFTSSAGAQTDNLTSDALGVLTIGNLDADDYQDIYVSLGGCESNTLLDISTLVDVGTPTIALGTITSPTLCGAGDGSIQLTGLAISTSYDVSYTNGSGSQSSSISSDGSGNLIIPSLSADFYENIKVEIGGCLSVSVGPVDLKCFSDAVFTVNNQTIDLLSNGSVLASATDADGPIVCASLQSGSLPAGVTLNVENGEISVSDETILVVSSATISIETIDDKGHATTQDVTIQILNDTPVANDDSYSLDEGATIDVSDSDGSGGDAAIFGLIVNDSDVGNSGLSTTLLTSPANHSGTFTLNANGTFTYIHDGSETTTDSFTYRLSDGDETDDATVTITINPVNDAPVAVADAYTFDEGSSNSVLEADGVLDNDTEAEGDDLTATLVTDVSNGTLTLNADGSFDYEHDGTETTDDSFTYRANDGTVDGNTETVTITINPVNDAPVAVADAYTFDEGSNNSVLEADGVLDNDTDAEGDDLTATLVTDVSNGTLTLNADGSFDYEHDGTETTDDSFTYRANDGSVDGNTETVTITINPVNDAPVAVADAYTFDEGGSNSVLEADGVLDNDTDAEGDDLTAMLVTDVSNGTLTLNADGSFDYEHDGTETTDDSFTYRANDGTVGGNTETVTITINPVNDAPVAVAAAYTFDEGSSNSVLEADGVLDNDTDAEGDDLTAMLVTDVSNGTLTLNADGSFDYEHDGTETTDDSFTYRANDGTVDGNTETVTITINPVNDAPVAVADAYTFDEGSSNSVLEADGVLDNDTDAEDDDLTATLVTDVSNGTLTLNADGSFDYEHDGTETTDDSFTYHANDGTVDGNTVTVSLTLTPVNDAPTAVDDAATSSKGATISINVAANDTDEDNDLDLGSIVIALDPVNGTLTNNNDGTISYTHDDSETTSDSFTYTIDDEGGATSNVATVSITVNASASNNAPVATADVATLNQGATILIDVVENDFDPDGNLDLSSIELISNPSNGTLTDNGDGTISYAHDDSETTSDSFSYTIDDNEGATSNVVDVTITINASVTNTNPLAADDQATLNQGATITIDVAANDSDADGNLDLNSIVLASSPANGTLTNNGDGTISYAHDDSETTSDSFTYTIDDNEGATSNVATVSITINPIGANSPPIAVNDAATLNQGATILINVASNDTDADGAPVSSSVAVVSNPSNGSLTVNGDGTISYAHDDSETTSDSFTYTIEDNEGAISNVATVNLTINVGGMNNAPVAVDDAATLNQGISISIDVASNDTDADGNLDRTTIVVVSSPSNGSVTVNGDGTISYAHDDSETTSDSFTYTIDDNEGATSNDATVSLTIKTGGANSAPVAMNDTVILNRGATITKNIAANDNDPDGNLDLSAIELVASPTSGTLTNNGDGTITYAHDNSGLTTDNFSYTIRDFEGAKSNVASVSLTINGGTNSAPTAVDDASTLTKGATVAIDVAANDSDADGNLDLSSIVLVTNPTNGSLTSNGDGTISYAHNDSETISDSFTYTIDDNEGATSNVATVSITINATNTAPTALDDAATLNKGAVVAIDVALNDSDADGNLDLSSIVLVSNPTNGSLINNGDGTVSYTHDDSETTSDSFTYTIDDNEGATSNVATVSLTINAGVANTPPLAMDDNATLNKGATIPIDVAANDSDTDGNLDLSSIVVVANPVNGTLTSNGDGTISYSHDDSDTTSDSFTYTINDNEGATSNVATVSITINAGANEAPVATDDSAILNQGATISINVAANDSDTDGNLDLGSIVLVASPTNGTVTSNGDGTVSYSHDNSETTSDSFTYTINDNEGATSNVATVSVIINEGAANNPPVASDDSATLNKGAMITIDLAANDSDSDGNLNLTSIVFASDPANGAVTNNGDGTVSYAHDDSETTSDSFTYTIADNEGANSNVATVSLTINPGVSNAAPLAMDDIAEVVQGASVSIDLVANDTDADGELDLSSILFVSTPLNGELTNNEDGSVSYAHDNSSTISDSFTYTVSDLEGAVSNVATVTITIEPEIDVPDAFTPNNDGVNDEWVIPGIEDYPDNIVKVFNRWGNKIIEIKGYNNRDRVWYSQSEGRLSVGGKEVPDGTYFYLIQLDEGLKPQSGFIVVNR